MENTLFPRCLTCKHWTQKTKYEHVNNEGFCFQLKDSNLLNIEIKTGWDGGYVEYVLTDEKFGCVEHEPKPQE